MKKNFKFFKGQSTSPLDAYAYRVINESHYGAYRIGQDEPPFGISRRNWNILPQDLRGATLQEMECYIRGWENARMGIVVNPYHDRVRGELWNRGFFRYQERVTNPPLRYRSINPDPPINETYPEYYNIEDFDFHDVSEVRYSDVTGQPYKVMLMRSVVSGNILEGIKITSDHPMYNFPDII